MLLLENADVLNGVAGTASKIDFTVHGLVGTILTQLGNGQLQGSIGALVTASAKTVVSSITLVNTHTAAIAVNLYITTGSGTRHIIPKDMQLGAGYSMLFDGGKLSVMDACGRIRNSVEILKSYVNNSYVT